MFYKRFRTDKRFLFCIPLRFGVPIIGVLGILFSVYYMAFAFVYADEYFTEVFESSEIAQGYMYYMVIFGTAVFVAHFLLLKWIKRPTEINLYLKLVMGICGIDILAHLVLAIALMVNGLVLLAFYQLIRNILNWVLLYYLVFNAVNGFVEELVTQRIQANRAKRAKRGTTTTT